MTREFSLSSTFFNANALPTNAFLQICAVDDHLLPKGLVYWHRGKETTILPPSYINELKGNISSVD